MVYLDLLRVAASYLIIIYHFRNQMSLGAATARVSAGLDGFTLAVDLFFFISGFVISSVYAERLTGAAAFRDYLVKRIARLLPLHWATFAVFAVFGALHAAGKLPVNHPEVYDARCAAPNLLLLHAFGPCRGLTFNYVSWSISAEMGMYLVFPLLLIPAARRGRGKSPGWELVAAVVALAALVTFVGADWLEWSFDGGVLRALPSFLLGTAAFRGRAALGGVPHAARWLGAACFAFLLACALSCPKLPLLLLVYAIGVLGIAASEQPASRAARRIAPLGQLTYSLYMLHPLVQTLLLTGVGATVLRLRGASLNLFVVAAAVLMIPIAWASLVLFERPARRWLTGLLASRPARRQEAALFTPDSRW
jgi:peptidoglycan/LPS O-acetylase OafA/YrhL